MDEAGEIAFDSRCRAKQPFEISLAAIAHVDDVVRANTHMLGKEGVHRAGIVLRGPARRELGVVAVAADHGHRVACLQRGRQRPIKLANLGIGLDRLSNWDAPPWELPRRRCAKLDIARPLDALDFVEREVARERYARTTPRDAELGLELVEIGLGEPIRRRQAGFFALLDGDAGVSTAENSDQ